MRRSEVWLARLEPKVRPVVLVSRQSHLESRALVLAVPVTTRVRGLETEVPLGAAEGLLRPCVAEAGSVRLVPKSVLTRRLGVLPPSKRGALDGALRFALGLD